MAEKTRILEFLQKSIKELEQCIDQPHVSSNDFDWVVYKIEWLVNFTSHTSDIIVNASALIELFQSTFRLLNTEAEQIQMVPFNSESAADIVFNGSSGRPAYNISKETLQYLLDLNFSITQIAFILRVSVSTVKRRLKYFSLSVTETYSKMCDEDLDIKLREILNNFPRTGYRRMMGFLKSEGMRIQEHRLRQGMHRVDPAGILERSIELTVVNRRKYCVKGTRSLWHIDGNHKLIRYIYILPF